MEPRECVVPSVSVILKRVYSFPNDELAPEKMEGRYISWLKKNPEYQQFLKIDDAFIFFMDLSKYGILGDVLDKMHFERENQFVEEITGNKGIIPEYHNFEGRYGQKKGKIGYDLKEIYTSFETGANKILSQNNIKPSLFQYKIEEWFLLHLASKKIEASEKEISLDAVSEINDFLDKLLSDHQKTVKAYRGTVYEYLHQKYFTKKKPQMEGIVTNILDLLSWLRQQGVAMRDFKPENILVAGNPEKNPNFLSSPKEYTLGLIDTETSVIYREPDGRKIEQPLLGGTPFYANPTQFFDNALLEELYGDVENILCLQDWYAAVAMIYFVVTGDRLFKKTARKLTAIIDIVEKSSSTKDSLPDLLKTENRSFWEIAVREFTANMHQKAEILKSLKANIPETAKEVLLENLRDERLRHTEGIKEKINTQDHFHSEENTEQLIRASSKQIVEFKKKWEEEEADKNQQKINWLKGLEKDKKALEQLDRTIKSLVQQNNEFTIYDLLELIFNMVLCKLAKRSPEATKLR
jgi:serine/threonine protein kinase